MRDDFCAFILTHGRPDRVYTAGLLLRAGYTGKFYIVIDDEDQQGDEYRRVFGDRVLVFSKDEVATYTDQFDNFTDRRAILWARNACWDLARKVGCRYFIQLDDDYTCLQYRRVGRREGNDVDGYHGWNVLNMDKVLEAMVRFMEATPTQTIAMSQGGDHFGGAQGDIDVKLKRKAMNTFVCDVERPIRFMGRINEDVNTYVGRGRLGELFFTYMPLQMNQKTTQSNSGGMTELYLDSGTYVKSFYTVMTAPSCVTIKPMGNTDMRLHHRISWRNAVPMIVAEKHRK
jgi:hypothetical protein